MRRPDSSALGAGISILALGVVLLLQDRGVIDLQAGWLLAAVTATVVLAVASRSLSGPAPAEETTAREREALRISRVGFAAAVVLGGALFFFWATGVLESAGSAALAAFVVTIALVLISAPLWWSMARRLTAERVARARSQERAEVAAHLHDSVLQTLALVQRRADEPEEVAKLARRQERELRSWLAGEGPARPGERLADALKTVAVEVEEQHGTQVEAVVVGDAPLDERLEALVAATREALTNAAKFASDGGPVRLYAEIEARQAKVFVDDRGPGFDTEAVSQDRRGIRESIIGRMERHGGRAEIRTGNGEGTEVELTMDVVDPMSETPTVVIVDDHRIFRSGVRAELGEAVEVLGEAESIEDAVRAITELEPDVVLLDVHMPGGGGVEVIEQVSKAQATAALPRPLGVRRPQGRDRHRPRRSPRLRHQDDHGRRARRGRPPSPRRRRRLLTPARRLRPRRLRRRPAR